MPALRDHTEITYGRLTALRCVGRDKRGHALWKCSCSCGTEIVVRGYNLQSGNTESCGCARREQTVARNEVNTTHGMWRTAEYKAWQQASQRTTNPKSASWKHYGGRGIDMAPEWLDSGGFERFYAHIGPRPDPSFSLDRINNELGYRPGNVRWADWSTQNRNKRSRRRAA